jgi:hypothetical protein
MREAEENQISSRDEVDRIMSCDMRNFHARGLRLKVESRRRRHCILALHDCPW